MVTVQMHLSIWRAKRAARVAICMLFGVGAQLHAATQTDAQRLIDNAQHALQRFMIHPEMGGFRQHLPHARGILIITDLLPVKADNARSHALLLARDLKRRAWTMPAFYRMSFPPPDQRSGLDSLTVMLLIMTQHGIDAMFADGLELGVDVSISIGPKTIGEPTASADILAFTTRKGVVVGLDLEGARLQVADDWSSAFYGRAVAAAAIVRDALVSNPGANILRFTLAGRPRPTLRAAQRGSVRDNATGRPSDFNLATIQSALTRRGYAPGPVDGKMGPGTERAIRRYQRDHALPTNGRASRSLERHLLEH